MVFHVVYSFYPLASFVVFVVVMPFPLSSLSDNSWRLERRLSLSCIIIVVWCVCWFSYFKSMLTQGLPWLTLTDWMGIASLGEPTKLNKFKSPIKRFGRRLCTALFGWVKREIVTSNHSLVVFASYTGLCVCFLCLLKWIPNSCKMQLCGLVWNARMNKCGIAFGELDSTN